MKCERNALQQEIPLLRSCLCDLSALCESIIPTLPAEAAGRIRRNIYRLHRLIGNMTDQPIHQPEIINLSSFIYETLEKAGIFLKYAGITLEFDVPDTPVFSSVDSQLLERGIYNLLALYCTQAGCKITARVAMHADLFRLSVIGSRSAQQTTIKWAQVAAKRHAGAVFTDMLSDGRLRTTLTLTLSCRGKGKPAMRIDYAGGVEHCLLELSDILPPQVYCDNYFCSR